MPMRVNHNISALNAIHQLNANNRVLGQKLERLSSGLRINRASDDAAGLSIREGMRAEISGLKVNVLNAEQATNVTQVAEGSLNEVNGILIRMRTLAVQSAATTVNDFNRSAIQAEFSHLVQEIDRIAQSTTYNNEVLLTGFGNTVSFDDSTAVTTSNATGVMDVRLSGAQTGEYTFVEADDEAGYVTLGNGVVTQTISLNTLLDGTKVATGTQIVANFDRLGIEVTLAGEEVIGATGDFEVGDLKDATINIEAGTGGSYQVGPTDSDFNRIEVAVRDMRATGDILNLGDSNVSDFTGARSAITAIDEAIGEVSMQRGTLGAVQNRLAFTISYTENEIENIQASESSISDADIASEVTAFTRAQILSQAATAMLAQANVVPQNALALLS
ncbi:MAG: flagellin [Candidatus Latescibacterota bacterium]|nr:flagellin [Candidatus Latescibacterota bacterium]